MEKLEINKQWKASQFNEYLGELKENSWVIYNNLSGAMVELNKRIYDAISNNHIEEITNPSIQNSLQRGKLIVDQNLEEIEDIKMMKEDMQKSALVLGFQVLPSSFCNFNCTYCYEKHVSNGVMPKSVMVSLIDFIKRKIKPTTRYFNISYFGTEPLTAPKQIDYLSNTFLELGEKNNIKTSQFIVTNDELCGNISDFDDYNPNFKKWGDVDNLNYEKCKLCSMVPLCKGSGCAFDALIKNKDISNCDQSKEHSFYLEKLKNLYIQKINEKGGQHGGPN